MAEFLPSAIESVLNQTISDLELVIVDDGSTDNTSSLVERYLEDPRVRYFVQPNSGQAAAKNRGIRESSGSIIGFCDADDFWKPEKLEVQLPEFAADSRIGVVHSRISQTTDGSNETPRHEGRTYVDGQITDELFLENLISFGTAMVRRECFELLGGFNEQYRMGIDWELWLRLSTKYHFRFVDRVTYVYRVWEGQMSSDWEGRYKYTFRIMRDFVAAYPDALDRSTVRAAYADAFTQKGRLRSFVSNQHIRGAFDVLRGLTYRPTSVFGWKSLFRVSLNAIGRKAE